MGATEELGGEVRVYACSHVYVTVTMVVILATSVLHIWLWSWRRILFVPHLRTLNSGVEILEGVSGPIDA